MLVAELVHKEFVEYHSECLKRKRPVMKLTQWLVDCESDVVYWSVMHVQTVEAADASSFGEVVQVSASHPALQ